MGAGTNMMARPSGDQDADQGQAASGGAPQQGLAASAPKQFRQEAAAAEAKPPQQEAAEPEVKAKSAAASEAKPSVQEPVQGSSQQGNSEAGMAAATDPDSGEHKNMPGHKSYM